MNWRRLPKGKAVHPLCQIWEDHAWRNVTRWGHHPEADRLYREPLGGIDTARAIGLPEGVTPETVYITTIQRKEAYQNQ